MIRVCYHYHKEKRLKRTRMPVLDDDVKKELHAIARKFQIDDEGFVQDLYLMLKSTGRALMSRKNAKRNVKRMMKDEGWTWTAAYKRMAKHYSFFRKLKHLPYFLKLCQVKDTYDAVERLLAIFKKLSAKTQPARCNACNHAKDCAFGKQFSKGHTSYHNMPNTFSIDHTKKVSKDCKEPPSAVDPLVHAVIALSILTVILDPIQGAAFAEHMEQNGGESATVELVNMMIPMNQVGKATPEFDATFTGESFVKRLEQMVDDVTSRQLAIFELARTFNETLLPGESEEKEDVEYISHDFRAREIRTVEEVPKALPGEVIDDDMMDKKLVTGELQVRQDMQRQKKKQYFHTLLDVSGSMNSMIAPNVYALHKKGTFASALCLSVIKKISLEQGTMLFRFFAGQPDRLKIADDDDSMADLARMVGISDFNGGGTEIMLALKAACEDIREKEKEGKGKAEILLISDAESYVDESKLAGILKDDIRLHVLDVSPQGYIAHADTPLRKLAASYYKVDPQSIQFDDIAKAASD